LLKVLTSVHLGKIDDLHKNVFFIYLLQNYKFGVFWQICSFLKSVKKIQIQIQFVRSSNWGRIMGFSMKK